MKHTPKNSITCIKCHECCKWMTFTLRPMNKQGLEAFAEYYERRGCKVKRGAGGADGNPAFILTVMVPYMCPELKIGGMGAFCRIYNKRPQYCKEYDGRLDPVMQEHCQLPKEEIIQVSTPEGPNPFYQCPFCGAVDPGELVCMRCGKAMSPPEDLDG